MTTELVGFISNGL